MSAHAVAVLLFSQPASAEAGRKPMGPNGRRTLRLLHALTRAKVRLSGLPLLESRTLIDHTGTFGEQLQQAVRVAFERGYERLICIGNDCPDLTVTDLRRAARLLTNGQLPLGADLRGGVYLIGLHRDGFNGAAFARLPWQTAQLAGALRTFFAGAAVAELTARTDLNRPADAGRVRWTGGLPGRLMDALRQCLARPLPFFARFVLPVVAVSAGPHWIGRAPPVA